MLTSHTVRPSREAHLAGLVDGIGYQSPQFGYVVTWRDPWFVAADDDADAASFVPGADGVVCMRDGEFAEVSIISADRRNLLNALETALFWTSPAYLSEYMEPGTEVVLSRHRMKTAFVVMTSPGTTRDNPVVTVKESYDLSTRVSVRATFAAELAIFHEAFQSLQQNVLIDGRSPLRSFSVDVLRSVFP